MTPLAAGQRWKTDVADIIIVSVDDGIVTWKHVGATRKNPPMTDTEADFHAWIARHDARLANEGCGDGG